MAVADKSKYAGMIKKTDVYPYLSRYGSHSYTSKGVEVALRAETEDDVEKKKEMMKDKELWMMNEEATAKLPAPWVSCKDENGEYLTEESNLDNGLADPYRIAGEEFRKKLLETVCGSKGNG